MLCMSTELFRRRAGSVCLIMHKFDDSGSGGGHQISLKVPSCLSGSHAYQRRSGLVTPSAVGGPAAFASPGNFPETQLLSASPRKVSLSPSLLLFSVEDNCDNGAVVPALPLPWLPEAGQIREPLGTCYSLAKERICVPSLHHGSPLGVSLFPGHGGHGHTQ